jgi:lytic murein transglycosylase
MNRRGFLAGAALALSSPSLVRAQTDALSEAEFNDWVGQLRPRALDAGVSEAGWSAALEGLSPDPVVIARRATAAETNRTVTDYILALLNGRGRRARAKYASVPQLADIERRSGVPGGPLVAFWGMESDYGGNIGDRDVLRAVATHGAAGSGGADWAEEFIAAARILQSGAISRAKMVGSYAGAMGQTQLMPTNYLKYGVDFDGDGRIDVWGTPVDALASAAAHLKQASGWRAGESWLEEVSLPADLDLKSVEVEVTQMPPADWEARGVRRSSGRAWSAADRAAQARLYLPAGLGRPAFLAFPNYDAFEGYNPSLPYAVGVCLLAKYAQGETPYLHDWPPEPALSREARMAAQAGLAKLGYYDGKIDGDLGRRSRKAVRDWQLATGRPRDGHLTPEDARALSA